MNGVYRVLTFSHDKGQDDGGYAATFDFHHRFNCFSSFNHCKSCMFLPHRGSLSVVAICPVYFLALSPAVFRRCSSISRIPAKLLLACAKKLMQCGFSNVRFWHKPDCQIRLRSIYDYSKSGLSQCTFAGKTPVQFKTQPTSFNPVFPLSTMLPLSALLTKSAHHCIIGRRCSR